MKILLYIFIILGFAVAAPSYAAELGFIQNRISSSVLSVDVVIDTENQPVNAISGQINLKEDVGNRLDLSGSIINFWVDQPQIKGGKISFGGVIPGGINSPSAKLFTIVVPVENSGKISFTNASALLNDGKGTPLKITFESPKINAGDPDVKAIAKADLESKDIIPPESFVIFPGKDSSMFGGNWFIAFLAVDKGGGIDRYVWQESTKGAVDEQRWQIITSPAVLKDQSRKSFVFVKAIDKEGNAKLSVLMPEKNESGNIYAQILIWCIIIAGLALLIWVWKVRKNHQKEIQ